MFEDLFIFLLTIIIIALILKKPRNDLSWKPQYSLLPQIIFDNNKFQISNQPDFNYDGIGHIRQVKYSHADYHFSDLKQIWLGLSHF